MVLRKAIVLAVLGRLRTLVQQLRTHTVSVHPLLVHQSTVTCKMAWFWFEGFIEESESKNTKFQSYYNRLM